MIDVLYDGKCGLCSKEIAYYRRVAPGGVFNWLDIATDPSPLDAFGISQQQALKRLHARDGQGRWHVGVAAFIVIWRHLPQWRLLAVILSLPGVKQVADGLYNRFADYRFARLTHCQMAAGTTMPESDIKTPR
jgi:predicted DCC family thiol-disulfide oxidoreductase YuxK